MLTYAEEDAHDEEGVHDRHDGPRQRRDDLRPVRVAMTRISVMARDSISVMARDSDISDDL